MGRAPGGVLLGYWCHRNITCVSMYIYKHYDHNYDVIMGAMASQITSLTIVYSTVYSGAHQRKHPSSASLAFVRGIHRGPGNSPHKWLVTRKMFPFDWRHHVSWSLIHHPLDKMFAFSQTIFSNAFSRSKSFIFWLKFHCSLLLILGSIWQ